MNLANPFLRISLFLLALLLSVASSTSEDVPYKNEVDKWRAGYMRPI